MVLAFGGFLKSDSLKDLKDPWEIIDGSLWDRS